MWFCLFLFLTPRFALAASETIVCYQLLHVSVLDMELLKELEESVLNVADQTRQPNSSEILAHENKSSSLELLEELEESVLNPADSTRQTNSSENLALENKSSSALELQGGLEESVPNLADQIRQLNSSENLALENKSSSSLEQEIEELYLHFVREGWIDPVVLPENPVLYIGNVDTKESNQDLEVLLGRYGELTKLDIKQRGQSKFCFVSFVDPYSSFNLLFDAKEIGVNFGNRQLVVKPYSKTLPMN